MRNPSIVEGVAEILEVVDTEYDLVYAEKRWMNKYFSDHKCLNHSQKTSRKINGVIVRPD